MKNEMLTFEVLKLKWHYFFGIASRSLPFFLFCFFVLFHWNCNLPNLSEEKDESISRSYRLTLAAFVSAINWKLTQVTKNSSRIMAYHVRFTIFRATITNSLNEEKLTKHKSDFASIFLTQPISNDVMDFDKFEKIFHHRNKLEPQKHNECLQLTSGKRWSDSPDFALFLLPFARSILNNETNISSANGFHYSDTISTQISFNRYSKLSFKKQRAHFLTGNVNYTLTHYCERDWVQQLSFSRHL